MPKGVANANHTEGFKQAVVGVVPSIILRKLGFAEGQPAVSRRGNPTRQNRQPQSVSCPCLKDSPGSMGVTQYQSKKHPVGCLLLWYPAATCCGWLVGSRPVLFVWEFGRAGPQFAMVALRRCRLHCSLAHWAFGSLDRPLGALASAPSPAWLKTYRPGSMGNG